MQLEQRSEMSIYRSTLAVDDSLGPRLAGSQGRKPRTQPPSNTSVATPLVVTQVGELKGYAGGLDRQMALAMLARRS